MHTFKSHLIAGVMKELKLTTTSDEIEHTDSLQWLQQTADKLVSNLLMPTSVADQVHQLQRSFSHTAFLCIDLREAIRWENGPHVVRHWKLWLPRFLGTGRKNYASEAVHLISNLQASFPCHIAYVVSHNRTVNIHGKPGRGKPIDQLMEHYNL